MLRRLAQLAHGLANDLASTSLLATDKQVLVAPAMNVRMWQHAATQRNLATLQQDGVTVIGPDDGVMACGEFGPGRMAEPSVIADAIETALGSGSQPLHGRHILVTSGPTHEPIDPVRYIANRSSGQQGFAIAAAAARAGARVTLIAGPVHLPTPAGVTRVDVETAREMAAAVDAALAAPGRVDVAVMVAAVADWRVADAGVQKLKKDGSGKVPPLALVENPDILSGLCASLMRPALVVGFAAETERVVEHAVAKRIRKGADWIVANDVSGAPGSSVMGGSDNAVHIITAEGVESLPEGPKAVVAEALVERIARVFV